MDRRDFDTFLNKLDWSESGQTEQVQFLGLYSAHRARLELRDLAQIDKIIAAKLRITKDELYALLAQQEIGRTKNLLLIHNRNQVLASAVGPQGQNVYAPILNPGSGLYPTEGFIGRFMTEVCSGMESPDAFLFWSAIAALSAATRRNVWFNALGTTLYTNHYVILVAPPGQARKGPPIKAAQRIVTKAIPDINYIDRTTTQRLPHDLAFRFYQVGQILQKSPADANGFLCAEELSAFLGNETFNKGIVQWLLDWWDCPAKVTPKTLTHGILTLLNIHITLLGGTTPGMLADTLPSLLVSGGMLTRMITVQEGRTTKRNVWGNTPSDLVDAPLVNHLAYISQRQGIFTRSVGGDKWMEHWYGQFRDYLESATTMQATNIERKQAHIIKTTMMLALSENRDFELTEDLFERAEKIVSDLERNTPELVDTLSTPKEGKKIQLVLSTIRKNLPHVTRSDLLRKVSPYGISGMELDSIIQTLVDQESIEVGKDLTSRKRSTIYFMRVI